MLLNVTAGRSAIEEPVLPANPSAPILTDSSTLNETFTLRGVRPHQILTWASYLSIDAHETAGPGIGTFQSPRDNL